MGSREPHPIRIIEDRWAVTSRVAQTLALILAGAWGFYTFVYQERIKPANATASLDVTFRLERAGTLRGGSPVVRIALHFHNNGSVPTDVYAEAVSLYGLRYGTRTAIRHRVDQGVIIDDASLPRAKPELVFTSALLRDAARGGVRGRHIYLRPGDSFDEPNYLALPRGRFQALAGEAHLVVGRIKPADSVAITAVHDADGGYKFVSEIGGSDFDDYLVL
ncbi:MAG TPA: hypothetical protein VGC96_13340 [Candidatus Elarobacter sp.]|jgi:hypothetical protein